MWTLSIYMAFCIITKRGGAPCTGQEGVILDNRVEAFILMGNRTFVRRNCLEAGLLWEFIETKMASPKSRPC